MWGLDVRAEQNSRVMGLVREPRALCVSWAWEPSRVGAELEPLIPSSQDVS